MCMFIFVFIMQEQTGSDGPNADSDGVMRYVCMYVCMYDVCMVCVHAYAFACVCLYSCLCRNGLALTARMRIRMV